MLRIIIFPFVIAALMAAARAEKRAALVIGISAYEQMTPLNNPTPDAKAVAMLLAAHGFAVTAKYDVSYVDFMDALSDFAVSASGADVAIIYYAGHGLEVSGKNILAARDMPDVCASRSVKRAVPLGRLFDAVAGARGRVVLLDACRNDPFPQCKARGTAQAAGFRGLARAGDTGLLIVNATLSGQSADDGAPGRHSPFARALLARLAEQPRAPLLETLGKVAGDVARGRRQTPEVIMRGEVPPMCLKEPCEEWQAEATDAAGQSASSGLQYKEASELWAALKDSSSIAQLEKFIREYGDTPFGPYARERLAEVKSGAQSNWVTPPTKLQLRHPSNEDQRALNKAIRESLRQERNSLSPEQRKRECLEALNSPLRKELKGYKKPTREQREKICSRRQ
jgi:hypothetical protein